MFRPKPLALLLLALFIATVAHCEEQGLKHVGKVSPSDMDRAEKVLEDAARRADELAKRREPPVQIEPQPPETEEEPTGPEKGAEEVEVSVQEEFLPTPARPADGEGQSKAVTMAAGQAGTEAKKAAEPAQPMAKPEETSPPPRPTSSSSLFTVGETRLAIPGGAASFADQANIAREGSPAPLETAAGAEAVLGPPDGMAIGDGTHLSLGCRGEAVLKFDDPPKDGSNVELVIIEVGDAAEAVEVSVSADGKQWRTIGVTEGGISTLKTKGRVPEGEGFGYVLLRDLAERCHGDYPGADIDAVAAYALPARKKLAPLPLPKPAVPPAPELSLIPKEPGEAEMKEIAELSSEVLFDFDRAELKEEGKKILARLLTLAPLTDAERVMVTGHTDATGPEQYNERLSRARARAVASFLSNEGIPSEKLHAVGMGEAQPVADNSTPKGRAQNRRVVISVGGAEVL